MTIRTVHIYIHTSSEEAHLENTITLNEPNRHGISTDRIPKIASWSHLMKVSPSLHPPEPPPTLIPLSQGSEGKDIKKVKRGIYTRISDRQHHRRSHRELDGQSEEIAETSENIHSITPECCL